MWNKRRNWGYIQSPQNKVLPSVDLRAMEISKPTSEAFIIESVLKHFQQLGKDFEMECVRRVAAPSSSQFPITHVKSLGRVPDFVLMHKNLCEMLATGLSNARCVRPSSRVYLLTWCKLLLWQSSSLPSPFIAA